jgi:hypothetical protein
MKQVVCGGRVGINLNGEPGEYFGTYKGLRQGDPLSLLLFNLVADALATILRKGCQSGMIKGLIPELVRGGGLHTFNMMMTQLYFWKLRSNTLLMSNSCYIALKTCLG